MGQGRARVCVAPGHGLLLRLDDPDCGRAPPRVGRRLPRIDLHRRSDWQAARRPEHHAVGIRLERTIGPSRHRCTTDRGPWLSVHAECADPIRIRGGRRPGARADLRLVIRERSCERPGGQDGGPGDRRGDQERVAHVETQDVAGERPRERSVHRGSRANSEGNVDRDRRIQPAVRRFPGRLRRKRLDSHGGCGEADVRGRVIRHPHNADDLPIRSERMDHVLDGRGEREVGVVDDRDRHPQKAGGRHRGDHQDNGQDRQRQEMLLPTPGRTTKACFGNGPHQRNSPRTRGAAVVAAIPSFQTMHWCPDDIIVPAAPAPRFSPVSRLRPKIWLVNCVERGSEAALAGITAQVHQATLHGKTLLYPHGNFASPPWRDFAVATDYVPASGLDVPSKSKPLSVFAAIPAFNEGPTIGSVVLRTKQYAEEVVVIDDGSKDDTAEIAALARAPVITHVRHLGKGTAIRTAWLFARERHPEALVLLDGDHQHNPKDIPRIVEPILAGKADVVLGVRWGKTSGMPMYRRIGKRALDYATAAATKNGLLTDSQCGFRVFSSRALNVIEPTENGLSIESQMLLEAQERNLRIHEVNIDVRYDIAGSTLTPGRHGTSVLGRIVTLVSEKRPLFFFGVSGAVLLLIAAALGVVLLRTYDATRAFAIGYAFIVVLFGIVGIVSIFIGITLNALRRIAAR